MSTSYEFNTPSYSVARLSEYFGALLGLSKAEPPADSPLTGPAWWVALATTHASDAPTAAARMGTGGAFASVTFEPRKALSWEEETAGLSRIIRASVALLQQAPNVAGYLEFYDDIVVLEKRAGGPLVVSPRLIDRGDLDDLGVFAPLLRGLTVAPIN
ncbi:hypothetical protein Afil01_68590 [Actinorhabdospora filicis]|uniref:Uncharacterized protein n=1 Tax=Actinorhabdospora filicis TaxID=1785913 RepID=A0A9W6SUG7_9ACTN|nr:hypothetical protein [Actinorhabdospora filicis]GLZ82052.1 hypothetical protein Afil01_68590 [Actinorhabdospora filicis]